MTLPNGKKIISLNVNCMSSQASQSGLRDLLRTQQPDLVFLQEINLPTIELEEIVEGLGFMAYTNVSDVGRGTGVVWRSNIPISNIRVVELDRIFAIDVDHLTIINVYGHSGRSKRMERRNLYADTLAMFIRGLGQRSVMVVGDFNCVLGNIDALNNPGQKKCVGLQAAVNTFGLVDVYREQKPNEPGYTFVRNNTASRLDRIYLSGNCLPLAGEVEVIGIPFTDHAGLSMVLDLPSVAAERKSSRVSYWKLNNSVLDHPDFLANFNDVYARSRDSIDLYDDIADWWELSCKPVIRMFLKQFSSNVTQQRKDTKISLYLALNESIGRGVDGFEDTVYLKKRLVDLLLVEAEGVKIRSRFQENQEKEKGSLYHLAREKKRGKANNLEKLKINDIVVDDSKVIEKELLTFYESLFNGHSGRNEPFVMDEKLLPEFLENVGKLSEPDKVFLDSPFTLDEMKDTIKALPTNKSPGLDGISNEFMKKVFGVISTEYLQVQNVMSTRQKINNSMRHGVTRLIPKVNDVPKVNELRPISMLPVDYTIKSRLITRRLKSCTDDLFKSGQLCGIPGKNILSGIHNMMSTMEYVDRKKLSAALVSFDMDKAFDRCYIPYVCKVLRAMNFPESLVDIIRDMHHSITTRFILNGLTNPIDLLFSIRQGDPLAMFLYIVFMEPCLLRLEAVSQGVRVADFEQLDEDYADDVELLLEKEEDFVKVDLVFKDFEKISGALVSRTGKSKVMGLGGWQNRAIWPLPWLQTVREMKVFGVYLHPKYQTLLDRNWQVAVNGFRETLMSFDLRSLNTVHQRVDVVNIFAASRLWYKAQVLPLPPKYAQQIESLIYKFVWRGKLEKLALVEIHTSRQEGGLGLVEIRSKSEALLIKQCCRMLSQPDERGYKHVKYWLGLYFSRYLPGLRGGPHAEHLPVYYLELKTLLEEVFISGEVDPGSLESVKVKDLYRGFTTTLPLPKVVYKYGLPWDIVWKSINHSMLDVGERELMFLLVHDILPTRVRLHRLGQADSEECEFEDGNEDLEHLFTSCKRVQPAWAWLRKTIEKFLPAVRRLSNFELLNVCHQSKILIFLISFYVDHIWTRKTKFNSIFIDTENMIVSLKLKFNENQTSQNALAVNLFG